jgi:hypothetical protein
MWNSADHFSNQFGKQAFPADIGGDRAYSLHRLQLDSVGRQGSHIQGTLLNKKRPGGFPVSTT